MKIDSHPLQLVVTNRFRTSNWTTNKTIWYKWKKYFYFYPKYLTKFLLKSDINRQPETKNTWHGQKWGMDANMCKMVSQVDFVHQNQLLSTLEWFFRRNTKNWGHGQKPGSIWDRAGVDVCTCTLVSNNDAEWLNDLWHGRRRDERQKKTWLKFKTTQTNYTSYLAAIFRRYYSHFSHHI